MNTALFKGKLENTNSWIYGQYTGNTGDKSAVIPWRLSQSVQAAHRRHDESHAQ